MEKGKAFRLLKILPGGLIVVLVIFLSWHYIKRPERAMAPADNLSERGINNMSSSTKNSGAIDLTPGKHDGYTVEVVSKVSPYPKPDINYEPKITALLPDDSVKQVKDTIVAVKSDLRKNDQDANSWIRLGLQYKTLGDYKAAKDTWEYAKYLSPTNIVPPNNLGDIYQFYLKDYKKAEENLKYLVSIDPTYIPAYRALYSLYGTIGSNEREGMLKYGLSKNPKSIDILVLLAEYYRSQNNKDLAKSYYIKASSTAKDDGNETLYQSLLDEANRI